jgi:hypothetical protein
MPGPIDYCFWIAGFLAEAYVLVCAIRKRHLFSYFSINFYMLAVICVNLGEFWILHRHGFASTEYYYFYYYTDSLLTLLLFFVVMGLYRRVFSEMGVSKYIRAGAALLLAGTTCFSCMVVHQNLDNLTGRFVVELGQNLYFVGVVLTYLLWFAVMKLRETRTRLVQLVLALGVYFSASAAMFALRNLHNLFPEFAFLKVIPPLINLWLPLAWGYTFTRVSEEARLATARLVRSS